MNRAGSGQEGQACQVPKKPAELDHKPQVFEAMQLLTDRRVRLGNALDELRGRLSGVLRPEGPDKSENDAKETLVPLADAIAMEAYHLDGMLDLVSGVLGRLEL